MSRAAAVGVVVALLAACGGGTEATKPDETTPPPVVETQPTEDEKFQAAHYQACDAMCSLLTRCAKVETKAHWDELSAADKQEVEQLGPEHYKAHTNQCIGGCQDADVSVRQVEVIRACVQGMPVEGDPEHEQCHDYLACLDKAQKSGD